MMKLLSAPPSPFGRKVKMAAIATGIIDDIELTAADPNQVNAALTDENPLGKIPVLLTEDMGAVYDSRVIVDYFDIKHPGILLPSAPMERLNSYRIQALCDGILDASILQIYETRFRPEALYHEGWIERQNGKVLRGLDELTKHISSISPDLDLKSICTACVLGYLDFRFEGKWRNHYPALVSWLGDFESTPAFQLTKPE